MNSRNALEIERERLAERYEEQPEARIFAPLADCNRKLGELDTALELCLTGLARYPEYSSAHVILGKIHMARGDDEAAREAYNRVLELDPQNLLALRQLAELSEAASNYEKAEELWCVVAGLELDSDVAEQRLAWIRARKERHSESEKPETEAIDETEAEETVEAELSIEEPVDKAKASDAEPVVIEKRDLGVPSAEIATMTLADIYAEQGFRAKALEIYRQIEARNPDIPTLQSRIAAIETDLAKVEHNLDGSHPSNVDQAELNELSSDVDELVLTPESESLGAAAHTRIVTDVRPSAPITAPTSGEAEEVAEVERFNQFRGWLDRIRTEDED